MLAKIFRREEPFFRSFRDQAHVIRAAATMLVESARSGTLAESASAIEELESRGDDIVHETFIRLNKTLITPLDPEDIQALSTALDDVLDGIEDSAHRLASYRVEPTAAAVRLCEIISACSVEIEKAVAALDRGSATSSNQIELNRLENEADQIVRPAIAALFDDEPNAIRLMEMKEIYEFLESTVDRCEDVADVLQNVSLKNS